MLICPRMHTCRVRDIEELAERSRKDREDSSERDKQAVTIQRQLLDEMQIVRNERDKLLRALNDANTKNSTKVPNLPALDSRAS